MIRFQCLHASITRNLAVEGKAEGIKQEGLTCTCGAVDQEEPLLTELIEADLYRICIGPEGLDLELMGLQRSPPLLPASRASCRSLASASLASRPC